MLFSSIVTGEQKGKKIPQKHVSVCSGPCFPVGFAAINFCATKQTAFCKEGCKLPRDLIGLYCFNKTSWETLNSGVPVSHNKIQLIEDITA